MCASFAHPKIATEYLNLCSPTKSNSRWCMYFQAVGDRGAWVWAFAQQSTLSPGLQLRAVTNQCFLYPEKFEATAQLHTKFKRSQAQVYIGSWGVHQVGCQFLCFFKPDLGLVLIFFFSQQSFFGWRSNNGSDERSGSAPDLPKLWRRKALYRHLPYAWDELALAHSNFRLFWVPWTA